MYDRIQQQARQAISFMRFVTKHFLQDDCRQNAAALTYTTLFAVVPIMTVTFAILSAIPSMQSVSGDIQNFVFRHFIPSSGMMVQNHLHDFSQQASHLTIVGVAMLFVTALLMLLTIERAFNQIWKVREARKGVVSFLRYWAVLSLGPLLLGLGFAVSSYVASFEVFNRTASLFSAFVPGLRVIPLLLSGLGFTLLYVAVPNCKVPLRAGFLGGFAAAVLFEAAKRGFGIFIGNFSSYKLIYGAFAAFPVFLLWIYLSWLIILFGVELTRALAVFREEAKGYRHPVLTIMDLLQLFYRKQQVGGTVSDVDAIAVLGKQEVEAWAEFSRVLLDQRIIRKTEEGDYVLCRNLDQLDFWEFYRKLPWPLPQPHDLLRLHADDDWAAVLRPALERVNDNMEQELRIPLGRILVPGEPFEVSEVHPGREAAALRKA